LLFDAIIIVLSFYIAFHLRFEFSFPARYALRASYWTAGLVVFKIWLLYLFNIYNLNWSFVGITELSYILKAWFVAVLTIYAVNLILRGAVVQWNLPLSVIFIDSVLSFGMFGFLRISKRLFLEMFSKIGIRKRTLIVGIDFTSERLVKELKASKANKLFPIAFIDEDKMRIGTQINGIPVYGGLEKIEKIIEEDKIDSVLINLPSASHKTIGEIFEIINKVGVDDIKIVPRIDEFNKEINVVRDIKDLDIEDLLTRQSVKVDFEDIRNFLKDHTILVSGAAGSIGSEIIRKLVHFGVKHIIGYEIDETEIFNLEAEIEKSITEDQTVDFVVGDVRDREKLLRTFERFRPDIIFHASAYKHVPLMESFPEEAVKTNILGTLNLAQLAIQYNVKKFINISTDKAVNPTSIMGASKRFSEIVCSALNGNGTMFMSVRFGNVLGSRGSVIPLFLEQIKNGGPVTVTHPDIERYFMSIPEAVLLVFQAAYIGKKGGEVFVLDMGEPVKIVDLAENLVRLNKMEPYKDIDIVFCGLRPGEKLFEELLTAEEGTDTTTHSKIYIARNSSHMDPDSLKAAIEELKKSLENPGTIKTILKKYIPYYHEEPKRPVKPNHTTHGPS
jgi:FlaA1/EpsC-like NDP-sugar epimerase